MYLFTTLIIASLSFFVEATPAPRSGFAIPLTKRSQLRDANGRADMARLRRSVDRSINKLHRGFEAYEKNTGIPHPSAPKVKRLEKRSAGHEPLIDMEYYGTLSVGNPSRPFTVNFDTGSSNCFIPGTICDSSCEGHSLYNPSDSSTAINLGQPCSAGYADGSHMSGMLYADDVTIAGYTAKNLTFGVATNYSGFTYPGWKPDGLCGLAFESLSSFGVPPLISALVTEDVLPENSFGLCPSELYIGGTNSQFYTGDFTYVPVTVESYWQTNMDGVNVNGQQAIGTVPVIIDSGTAMIIGDNNNIQAIYDQIPGSYLITPVGDPTYYYYGIPCSYNSSLSFQFGGTNFTISAESFNFGTYTSDSDKCVGGLVSSNDELWTIGDVWLKNVYTEFDIGNKRLGFATAA